MARKTLTLEAVNARLAAAKIGLVVEQRGDRLSLRGTLPPKPGSKATKPTQQRLSLGVMASAAGLEYAEAKALEIGSLLAQHRFNWIDFEQDSGLVNAESCEAWIERFRKQWEKTQTGTPEQIALMWNEQFWYPAFKKLPPHAKLTAELISTVVERGWKPRSRSRQIACQKMARLAEMAGIEVNLKDLQRGYNPTEVDRIIPDDDTITAAIDGMTNPEWQWIAGMMATFGLRDHEAFLCRLEERESEGVTLLVAVVEDGKTRKKTGERECYPLPPEWCDRWDLRNIRKPAVNTRILKEYGDRTSKAFQRQKVGFAPYCLRHAWAIRAALILNLPTAIAARMLGHDPTVNLAIYQRHISQSRAAEAFVKALGQIERK